MSSDDIHQQALTWHRDGVGAALATVVQTWGSAPRPVGSQLAISGDAQMVGSVSGGCVEGAVVAEALDALSAGTCRVLEYGVSDDDAFAVGLACGGTIRIMVEPIGVGQGIGPDMIGDVIAAKTARQSVVIDTDTETWQRKLRVIAPNEGASLPPGTGFDDDNPALFQWICTPPLRLAIIGAVHIAQALSQMAAIAGYDVTVIDPREAFASAARFPGTALVHQWPDEALDRHGLDHGTAVVTLTHDPKLDDPALIRALGSDAFYIGALGSRRTHAKRVQRLLDAGFSEADIARIDAPVGLDIGAKSPAEIAVATLAELTERLRKPASRAQSPAPNERVA